jgi:hypothetical protein
MVSERQNLYDGIGCGAMMLGCGAGLAMVIWALQGCI